MKTRSGRRTASALVLLLPMLGVAVGSPSQEQTGPLPGFEAELDVHLITVRVTAETATGRSVRNLQRDDFLILEDGEPRQLTLFLPPASAILEPIRPEEGESHPGSTAPVPESPYRIAGVTDAVSDADQRVVLGFDFLSMTSRHLRRAVSHCKRLLEEGRNAEGVLRAWSVVVLGAEPWMLLPYTADERLVVQALDELEQFGDGAGFQAWARGSFLTRDRELAAQKLLASAALSEGQTDVGEREPGGDSAQEVTDSLPGRAEAAASPEQFVQDVANRLQARALTGSARSVADLFRSLGGDDGDRALVYFFRGGSAEDVEMPEGGGGVATAERQLVAQKVLDAWREVAEVGSSYGFRVFGVDLEGLGVDAGYRGLSFETGFSALGDESRAPRLDELFPEDVALTLATGTGGKLVESNDFAAGIEEAAEAAANTYVLGYQVARPRDGRRHRLEIRVPGRRGLVLRYAPFYVDLPPRQRLLEALGTSANLPKRQGRLPLVFQGRVVPHEDGYRVEVEASLPVWRLGLVRAEGEGSYGEVELFLAVYDRAGSLLQLQSKRDRITVAPGARSLVWRRSLELQEAPGTIAVALLDRVDERYAIASARLGS